MGGFIMKQKVKIIIEEFFITNDIENRKQCFENLLLNIIKKTEI